MVFHEAGDSSKPIILLLAPMDVTGQDMFEVLHSYLGDKFCYVYPDLSGSGEDTEDFLSAEKDSQSLSLELKKRGYNHISLMLACSLGTTIALHLMRDTDLQFDAIHLDGATFMKKLPKILKAALLKRFLSAHKKCKNNTKRRSNNILHRLYGKDWGDRMTKNFISYSETTIQNNLNACFSDTYLSVPKAASMVTVFDYGSKDADRKFSKKGIHDFFPDSKIIIRKGYNHCEYLVKHPKEYADELLQEMNK